LTAGKSFRSWAPRAGSESASKGGHHQAIPVKESTMPAKATLKPTRSSSPEIRSVLGVAERLHAMNPEWVVFFREILGIDGVVRRSFRTADGMRAFECSPEYARIKEMLDDLRQRPTAPAAGDREVQRVVTVRMPRSLHESLKNEADDLRVSINTLCIAKLMKLLDAQDRRTLEDMQAASEPAGRPRRAR
jgi:predicted HicB family RNase H-like nuclease